MAFEPTEQQKALESALLSAAVKIVPGDNGPATVTVPVVVHPHGENQYLYEFAGYKTEPAYFPAFDACLPVDQVSRVTHVEVRAAHMRDGNPQIQQFALVFETSDIHAVKKSQFMEIVRVSPV